MNKASLTPACLPACLNFLVTHSDEHPTVIARSGTGALFLMYIGIQAWGHFDGPSAYRRLGVDQRPMYRLMLHPARLAVYYLGSKAIELD